MAVCPHCTNGHPFVEELGLRMHKFSDHWISCNGEIEAPGKEQLLLRATLLRVVLSSSFVLIRTVLTRMPVHFR